MTVVEVEDAFWIANVRVDFTIEQFLEQILLLNNIVDIFQSLMKKRKIDFMRLVNLIRQ